MKLRTKFSLLTCSLTLLVIAGVSIFLYIEERNLLLREIRETRSSAAAGLARVGRESEISSSRIQLINYIRGITIDDTVVYAAVLRPGGEVIAHSDPDRMGSFIDIPELELLTEPATIQDFKNGKELLISHAPVEVSGEVLAQALVAFSSPGITRIIDDTLAETRKRIFGIAGIGLILGFLGAVLLSAMMVKPIRKMAAGAESIGSGKLDTVIEVTSRDELGSLARTLNRMANKLAELDRMKQDFVSGITHEFRSPLNAMGIHFDLLIKERLGGINEKQRESLMVMKKNSKRLENFINALLDTAKLERGKLEIIPENFRAEEVINEVISLYRVQADKKNIELKMETGDIPRAYADPERTGQVLTNLISNAIKFTPEKGTITVKAVPEGDYIRVSVIDTGMGIPEDQLDSIFSKFEQVKGIRKKIKGQKGTGLGLAIVKGIVRQQGGDINVKSKVGEGAEFIFTLPAEKNE